MADLQHLAAICDTILFDDVDSFVEETFGRGKWYEECHVLLYGFVNLFDDSNDLLEIVCRRGAFKIAKWLSENGYLDILARLQEVGDCDAEDTEAQELEDVSNLLGTMYRRCCDEAFVALILSHINPRVFESAIDLLEFVFKFKSTWDIVFPHIDVNAYIDKYSVNLTVSIVAATIGLFDGDNDVNCCVNHIADFGIDMSSKIRPVKSKSLEKSMNTFNPKHMRLMRYAFSRHAIVVNALHERGLLLDLARFVAEFTFVYERNSAFRANIVKSMQKKELVKCLENRDSLGKLEKLVF